MKFRILSSASLLIFLLAIEFTSCKKDEDKTTLPTDSVQVNFTFNHRVGSAELQFDTIIYENAFGNIYSVSTLKYIISDFTFHKTDGTSFKIDDEHYVDARDENTLLFTPGDKVAPGTYNSISFIFGLNEEKNVLGLFPNPPENNMEWPLPMGGGYHYMKLEGKHNLSGTINNFQAHTGPTMGAMNYIEITLPVSDLVIQGTQMTIGLKMDINHWWDNPNMLDLNTITAIMGDQEMQVMLQANGADVFGVESVK